MNGVYIGRNRMLVVPKWGGFLHVIADDLSLTPTLVASGVFEPVLTKFISTRIQAGQTVVDIGANVGYFSVLLGHLVGPSGHLYTYEANPSVFELLVDNLSMNGLHDRTTAQCIAIHSEKREVTLYKTQKFNGNSSLLQPSWEYFAWFQGDQVVEITVPADTLDSLLGHLPRIDFVKMDIEGGEYHAFLGMRSLLTQGVIRTVAFELNRLRLGNSWAEFMKMLSDILNLTDKSLYLLDDSAQPVPVSIGVLNRLGNLPYVILE